MYTYEHINIHVTAFLKKNFLKTNDCIPSSDREKT